RQPMVYEYRQESHHRCTLILKRKPTNGVEVIFMPYARLPREFVSVVRAAAATPFAASLAFAQSVATLTGAVVDPSKAVVQDAQVVSRNIATGLSHTTRTNAEGLFRFPELPIGAYEVTVSHTGFERLVRG